MKWWTRYWRIEVIFGIALATITALSWIPRLRGPLELRSDGSVYYILGTSLFQGTGYRLTNEPGDIEAVQYPPLMPAIIALHQFVGGTTNPFVVGSWLKGTWIVFHSILVAGVYPLMRRWLPAGWAFIASLLYALNFPSYFHFALCYAELPFVLASIAFLYTCRTTGSARREFVAGALATCAFLLRSAGIMLIAAWIVDSLVRKDLRRAALRLTMVLPCVLLWNLWIYRVEASPEYAAPAYAYQRADYMFYNVSYARNISYVDPFRPYLGRVTWAGLFARFNSGVRALPIHLGEAATSETGFWEMQSGSIRRRLGFEPLSSQAIAVLLATTGVVSLCGLILLVVRGEYVIPLYVGATLLVLCVAAPWPEQQLRYLVQLAPLLILGVVSSMRAASQFWSSSRQRRWPRLIAAGVMTIFLANSIGAWYQVHKNFFPANPWIRDARGQSYFYRQLFENSERIALDQSITWLAAHAGARDVIAAAMPQWVYLRTGLKSVMPPMEVDPVRAQKLLDSVPVRFLIREPSDVFTSSYVDAVLTSNPTSWKLVFTSAGQAVRVYELTRPNQAGNHPLLAGRCGSS